MKQKKRLAKMINLAVRVGLFSIVLSVGILVTLIMGETEGLASTALPPVSVQAMAAQQNIIYADMKGEDPLATGVYRSTDNGATWQKLGLGPGVSINTLAIHPFEATVLYAGTGGGPFETTNNLWTSPDSGQSWYQFYLRLPADPSGVIPDVTALAIDPLRPDEFYVGTAGQGIYHYKADIEGYGYELFGGISLPGKYVKALVVSPDRRVYALTTDSFLAIEVENLKDFPWPNFVWHAGDGNLDQTASWQKIETLPDLAASLAIDPTDPQVLYAGTVGYGAYRSGDGGQTWQAINEGLGWQPGFILRVSTITIDEADPHHLALATAYGVGKALAGGGVYESVDQGRTWVKLADSPTVINHLMIKAGGVYAATAEGLVRYGPPLEPATVTPLTRLGSLTQLTGTQIVILGLTLILAGLILVGRIEWILKPKLAHVENLKDFPWLNEV